MSKIQALTNALEFEEAALRFQNYLNPFITKWIDLQIAIGKLDKEARHNSYRYEAIPGDKITVRSGKFFTAIPLAFFEDPETYSEESLKIASQTTTSYTQYGTAHAERHLSDIKDKLVQAKREQAIKELVDNV